MSTDAFLLVAALTVLAAGPLAILAGIALRSLRLLPALASFRLCRLVLLHPEAPALPSLGEHEETPGGEGNA